MKGAYWDYETIEAEQRGWPVPVYTNKAESDANYEVCAKYLLENIKHIRPAFASHNVRTLAACMIMAGKIKYSERGFGIPNALRNGRADQKNHRRHGLSHA